MSAKPKPSELVSRQALQTYQLLHVAMQDLSQAAFFCDHLRVQGWTREPWEGRWQNYLHQGAYVTAMVIAYCRPFTDSRGWPKFPKRLLRLTPEERELHERLLSLRNAVYAHSDIEARNIRPVWLNEHPTAVEALPPMRFSMAELESIRKLIYLICMNIAGKLDELFPSVKESSANCFRRCHSSPEGS